MTEQKKKKYYKEKEYVWIKELKARGRIKSLDLKNYEAMVTYFKGGELVSSVFKLWEITKLRKDAKAPVVRYKGKGLNYAYDQVKAFHTAFGHPVAEFPTPMSLSRAINRAGWVSEENDEFILAANRRDKNGNILTEEEALVAMADALCDIIYFALGSFVELGVAPQRLFDIVQNSNMAKLFPDGKPRYREGDGKIIKPEGWEAPEPKLAAEVQRQMKKGQ